MSMFNIYNTNTIFFSDKDKTVALPFKVDIEDYEDYITIETQISLDGIARGWIGDITIRLYGCNYLTLDDSAEEDVVYKDMLCVRRIFNQYGGDVTTWKYMFMKY